MAQLDVVGAALALFVTMTVALIVLLVVLRVAKARVHRRVRAPRLEGEDAVAEDRVYTALVTSEAIAHELEAKGMESAQAQELLREARQAFAHGGWGKAGDLAQEARALLAELRTEEDEATEPLPLSEEEIPESKPVLGKEYARNFLQAKFLLGMVKDAIGKGASKRKKKARKLLREAQDAFDEETFDEAVRLSMQAKRILEGEEAEKGGATSSPAEEPGSATPCPSCETPVGPEDTFCGKCGTRLAGPSTCPECGAGLAGDDRFCRQCGTDLVPLAKTG